VIPALLVLAAAAAVAWPWIVEQAKAFDLHQIERRHVVAAALVAAALTAYATAQPQAGPTPAPPAPESFSLQGRFVGPDAAADAATTAALCEELASEIEWDGMQAEQLLKTGVSFDELRRRARLLLCRGVSLGEKHPLAREAIKSYLDQHAGTSGGPVSPAQRSAWVAAFRDIARAAADASR
jgi:hypothetical protein